MSAFVVYDSAGVIQAAYRVASWGLEKAMVANATAGLQALAVPDDSPAILNQSAYKVVNGQLQPA